MSLTSLSIHPRIYRYRSIHTPQDMEKDVRRRNLAATSRSPSPIIEASEEAELRAELSAAPAADVELLQPASFFTVWMRRLAVIYRLGRSRALLPDSIRYHPVTAPVLLLLAVVLYFVPTCRVYLGLIFLGVMLGYIYIIPEAIIRPKSSSEESFLDLLFSNVKYSEKFDKSTSYKLNISPMIDSVLDSLLDDVLVELINPWYVPLCRSGENEFQSCVRSTVNASIMNLLKFGATINNDTVTLLIYGITNALIVHMEEFRRFETSQLPLDRFIASERTRRAYHKNYSDELDHLRQISGLLLKKLLPKHESRSILLNSMLKEIISGNAFAGLIDRLSDPDFINEQIVKHMQDPAESIPSIESGWNMVVLKCTTHNIIML